MELPPPMLGVFLVAPREVEVHEELESASNAEHNVWHDDHCAEQAISASQLATARDWIDSLRSWRQLTSFARPNHERRNGGH